MPHAHSTPAPLSADQAWGTLMQRVYIPAFIEKLAVDHGIQIQTQDQLEQALIRAAQLRELYDQQAIEKQASYTDEFTAFGQFMDSELQDLGQPAAPTSQLVKTAAQRGSADPELIQAVLSLAVAGQQSQQSAA